MGDWYGGAVPPRGMIGGVGPGRPIGDWYGGAVPVGGMTGPRVPTAAITARSVMRTPSGEIHPRRSRV